MVGSSWNLRNSYLPLNHLQMARIEAYGGVAHFKIHV